MADAAWQCNPLVHVQTDELELNSVPVELGAEQLHWLCMYGSIDLAHWRWIALGLRGRGRWVYVGCERMPNAVRSYVQRQRLLDANEFHYWPGSSCKGGGLAWRGRCSPNLFRWAERALSKDDSQ